MRTGEGGEKYPGGKGPSRGRERRGRGSNGWSRRWSRRWRRSAHGDRIGDRGRDRINEQTNLTAETEGAGPSLFHTSPCYSTRRVHRITFTFFPLPCVQRLFELFFYENV